MAEGIQLKKGDEGNGIQVWGTSNNPGSWEGIGLNQDCCPCDCGCPEFEACLRVGERFVATITSDCEELDGIVKYLVVGEGDTDDGNDCWTFEQDSGYGDCLILNPGEPNLPSLICCDNNRTYCEDAQGCMRYYLVLRAYECNSEPQWICATSCSCGESGVGFYLNFDGIVLDGSPYETEGGTQYLCGCDCDWPVTINIHVEREFECCCTNIENPAPLLLATIGGDPDECAGTMEGATGNLAADGETCRGWTTTSPIEFNCDDAVTYQVDLEMECVQSESPASGGCCDDYQLTLTYVDCDGCDDEYATQTAGVVGECTCLPLSITFGPFRLWTDPGDSGCECCEEFYITITEVPT